MYGSRMWANLFTQQPQTVFGAYAQTANTLDTLRQNQMKNALSQIQLNAAPQLMNQALQQGAAKTSVMQNSAQYAPQLSALDVQQKQILNTLNSEKANELPQTFKQQMMLRAAQIEAIKQRMGVTSGAANSPAPTQLNNALPASQNVAGTSSNPPAGGMPAIPPASVRAAIAMARQIKDPRKLMTAYDPNTGMQMQIPKNFFDPNASPVISGQATVPTTGSFVPPVVSNPARPDLLLPAGPSSSRGVPSALYDPATNESLSVIGQTQRNKVQNQVYAAQLAQELLPAIKGYGTEGKFQAAGISKYFPQWAGGTTFDDAAKYKMAKNMAVEHIMSSTNLRSTDQTTEMMNAVLDRQNGESRQGYAQRIDAFNGKLSQILSERNRTLKLGAMPLETEQKSSANAFLMDAYNKALDDRKGGALSNMVKMISPNGQTYNVSREEAEEAAKNGWEMG